MKTQVLFIIKTCFYKYSAAENFYTTENDLKPRINNVKTIELGVQSTNDYILRKAGRGHTFEDVKKASKLIRMYGFDLGHQMIAEKICFILH